jgi:hypothetical protein
MAHCHKCRKKFPIFTIRDVRRLNPFGNGYLCEECYQPYGLVLEKYTTNLKKADTDPKAAAWVALCHLLAAQRVNLVRTLTVTIMRTSETKNSWEVCRQGAIELATKAMSMLPNDSEGQVFLKGILTKAAEITESPSREIPIQVHASPLAGSVLAIEYEAVVRSGVSINELDNLVASLPGHQWLLAP